MHLPQLPESLRARYRPIEIIGRGGAGVVLRAHDRRTGRSVALKLIERAHLQDPHQRRTFLREARAIVRLEHPHVVRLLDFDLPRDDAQDACLVMEYLADGHLGAWRTRWPGWLPLLEVLDGVLAALAYAHARGIIHCDLKPENILFSRARVGLTPCPKLVDFGVARLAATRRLDALEEGDADVLGTPSYMAPEQAEGHIGALGPWTDLYALGVILYELLSGAPPFQATSIPTLLLQHLGEPPPPLSLQPGIPELAGIRELILRLLAKPPWRRPRFAAHVRRALARLRERAAALDAVALARSAHARTPPLGTEKAPAETTLNSFARLQTPDAPGDDPRAIRLDTPGLRMLRLKEPPLVGRDDVLAALEAEVDAVIAEARPRLVLLEGPAGIGTSRVAQTLQECLEESGRMQSWSCSYRIQTGGPTPGLRAAIESHHLCLGLARALCEPRLTSRLQDEDGEVDPWELRNLLDWLRPVEGAGALSDATLVGVSRRSILRAARAHPLYLWIDDLHHAPGGPLLQLLELLLDDATPAQPCLIVATLRTPSTDPGGHPERIMRRLSQHPRVLRVTLSPLPEATLAEMLSDAVGLGPRHALRLARDADGNPSRALQAARASIELDALPLSADQARDEDLTLSHDADSFTERARPILVSPLASGRLLAGHVAEVLDRLPQPDALRALGMLSLLGDHTPLELLRRALHLAWGEDGGSLDAILDEAARGELLVWHHDATLGLEHGPLIRFLTQHLEGRGELADAHRAAARALAERFPERGDVDVSRARHHQLAGDPEDAWRLMRRALNRALQDARYAQALALSTELEDWLHGWGLDATHTRFGVVDRARARAELECGALDDAERHLQHALERGGAEPEALAERAWLQARIHAGRARLSEAIHAFEVAARGYTLLEDDAGLARCVLGLARAQRTRGHLDIAEREARRALELFSRADTPRGVGDSLRALGQIALLDGRHDDARAHYQRALDCFTEHHDVHGSADIQRAFAGLLLEEGETERACELLQEAMSAYELIGDRQGLAYTLRGLARAERSRAQITRAGDHLERAARLLSELGDALGAADTLLDLASLERERGALTDAIDHAEDARRRYERAGDTRGLANALLILGNTLLDSGDHDDALTHQRHALRLFEALHLEHAARLARLNLGHTLLEVERLDEAAAALTDAASQREADPDTAAVADAYLAILAVRSGDDDALHGALQRARASTCSASVCAELGHAFEQLASLLEDTRRELARDILGLARARYEQAGRVDFLRQLVHRHPGLFYDEPG